MGRLPVPISVCPFHLCRWAVGCIDWVLLELISTHLLMEFHVLYVMFWVFWVFFGDRQVTHIDGPPYQRVNCCIHWADSTNSDCQPGDCTPA